MEYETFVDDIYELKEGEIRVILVRELSPSDRRKRYFWRKVEARVSRDPNLYPSRLWLRYPRGQLHENPYSVEIISTIPIEIPNLNDQIPKANSDEQEREQEEFAI